MQRECLIKSSIFLTYKIKGSPVRSFYLFTVCTMGEKVLHGVPVELMLILPGALEINLRSLLESFEHPG